MAGQRKDKGHHQYQDGFFEESLVAAIRSEIIPNED
jgi:hypothetical protein